MRISILQIKKLSLREVPGGPVVGIHLPVQGTWVQSLVGELRPHMLPGNQAHTTATEPTQHSCWAHVPQQERPKGCNEEPVCHSEDPGQPKHKLK